MHFFFLQKLRIFYFVNQIPRFPALENMSSKTWINDSCKHASFKSFFYISFFIELFPSLRPSHLFFIGSYFILLIYVFKNLLGCNHARFHSIMTSLISFNLKGFYLYFCNAQKTRAASDQHPSWKSQFWYWKIWAFI